jgi:hypothetical protein
MFANLEEIMHEVTSEIKHGLVHMTLTGEHIGDIYAEVLDEVLLELDDDFVEIEKIVDEHHEAYPQIIEHTQTQLAGYKIIMNKLKIANNMTDKGMFLPKEMWDIEKKAGKSLRDIYADMPADLSFGNQVDNISLKYNILRALTHNEKEEFKKMTANKAENFSANQVITQRDVTEFTDLYFVKHGFVFEEWGTETKHKRGKGHVFGRTNYSVPSKSRWYTTLTAGPEGCTLIKVSLADIRTLANSNPEFAEDIVQSCFGAFVHFMDSPMKFNPFHHMTEKNTNKIGQFTRHSNLRKGENIIMRNGGLVVEGLLKVTKGDGSMTYVVPDQTFVLPSPATIVALEDSSVLVFEAPVFEFDYIEGHGPLVKSDISRLGKGASHHEKYSGTNKFATHDITVPLGTSKNAVNWRKYAKEAGLSKDQGHQAAKQLLLKDHEFHHNHKGENDIAEKHMDGVQKLEQEIEHMENGGVYTGLMNNPVALSNRRSLALYLNNRKRDTEVYYPKYLMKSPQKSYSLNPIDVPTEKPIYENKNQNLTGTIVDVGKHHETAPNEPEF